MTDKDTVKFTVPSDDKENMRRILRNVYEALTECLERGACGILGKGQH